MSITTILPEHPTIIAVGSYLPEDCVRNAELVQRTGMESSDEAIRTLTGIEQRHFTDGELPSDMGAVATRRALDASGIDPGTLGGLYVSSMTRDMIAPDTSLHVHSKLGLPRSMLVTDIGGICAGSIMALHEASNMTQLSGRRALAVGIGHLSPVTNFKDRRSAILFGDGAGAFVIANTPGANRPAFDFAAVPDPEAINVMGGGVKQPLKGPEDPAGKIAMQGRVVAEHAVDLMSSTTINAARKAGVYDEQKNCIDWGKVVAFIPHQANLRLVERVGAGLNAPGDKVVATVSQHGNTSAASIPLAMDHARREGRFDGPGPHRVIFTAIGAGMVAGACVMDVSLV